MPVRLRLRWKDQQHARAVPKEFRTDVIAVARQGDQSIAQVVFAAAVAIVAALVGSILLDDRRARRR